VLLASQCGFESAINKYYRGQQINILSFKYEYEKYRTWFI
jgi:hypothetical protein